MIEDKIVAEVSENLRKTYDFEILADVLCRFGWTSVRVQYSSNNTWYSVMEWADKNCVGKYKEHDGLWIFENPGEATWFKMRWG